jgi:hypothetical protein
MARTAVVAGTATAVSGGMRRRQANRYQAQAQDQADDLQMQEMQAQLNQLQAQQAPPPPPPGAAPAGDDMMAQLEKLGQLHASGVLDDAEFAAAKAKLLA